MTEETNLKGEIVYKCRECGLYYKRKDNAEKCQNWCEKHKSCNLNITKNAIKIGKKK